MRADPGDARRRSAKPMPEARRPLARILRQLAGAGLLAMSAAVCQAQVVIPPTGPIGPGSRPTIDPWRPSLPFEPRPQPVPRPTGPAVSPQTDCRITRDFDGDGAIAIECGGNDCDDRNARRYPGAPEICDAAGIDEDCNPTTFGALDQDGDGFVSSMCRNTAPGGALRAGGDCNDTRRTVHPIAPEVCDGFDNNCDGVVDEGVTVTLFVDADRDGFGDPARPVLACAGATAASALGNDCDDGKVAVRPGSVRCAAGAPGSLEICASDGAWSAAGACPSGDRCDLAPAGFAICVAR